MREMHSYLIDVTFSSLSKWKLNIALKFCLEMWSLVEQQALYHTINEAGRSKCAPNSFRHKEAK
jgi:hypothetical protein